MAQKINANALRLEKTNQHYKGCWYSDYYYSNQLQNNYKICKYIDLIFSKIKVCAPDYFIKAHHQCNQIFCFFSKKRRKVRRNYRQGSGLHSRHRPGAVRARGEGEKVAGASGLLYGLLLYNRSALTEMGPSLPLGEKNFMANYCFKGPFLPWIIKNSPRQGESLGVATKENKENRVECNPLLQALIHRGLGRNSFFANGEMHRARMARIINNAQFPLGQGCDRLGPRDDRRRANAVDKYFSRGASTGEYKLSQVVPWRKKGATDFLGVTHSHGRGGAPLAAEKGQRETLKTYIYPIKVPFAHQSGEFLAQKICWALAERIAFGRLRRQILWDVKASGYVKGVRVSCAGRVESKSKKAQKARTRTFQWGQTELHVFSSMVQFTSKALITPFGKIGVKVWLCYGS